ncbi:MAG: histidine kinase, partial [Bowdeniella nasicola]|nr:histidine kinase [Bowdeniella nasicola]
IALTQRYSAAAQRQRLTLAADLHDVLGQQLTAMSVKAELLSKLLPADTPVAARQQADDLANLARQALTDVRAVVAGTRRAQLEVEIKEAANLLEAAGIQLHVTWQDRVDELSGLIAEVGPYLVREGAANIVHHATSATRAALTIGAHHITLRDNGHGEHPPDRSGAGLAGLRERIGELGKLTGAVHPDGGWQLQLREAGQ